MAQNYAATYAPMAEEAFALGSLTSVFSAKYNWTGVKTVNVFTNTAIAAAAYVASAGYGTPGLIANTVDDLVVAKDRKFVGLLDRLLADSTEGAASSAAWLGMETRQVVTPDIDAYRFGALFTACPTGQISATGAITSANAYTKFLTGQTMLDENAVPTVGRVAFCVPSFINLLKQDSNYVKASDLGQQIIINGQVGEIDGVPVVKVPSASHMNKATDNHVEFMIVHKDAVAAPMKLEDVEIFETVPLYSGSLIQGRYVHDCFLLDAMNAAIYIPKHAG